MQKVKIFFKSGNILVFKCKSFDFKYEKNTYKREIEIEGANINQWMIDANEIEAFTIKQCWW